MAGPDLTGTPGVTDETGQPDLAALLAALTDQVTGLLNAPGAFAAGQISWTAGSDPPPGWLIADGSTFDVNVYAQLATILPTGILPDLRDAFVVGAGSTYALLSTGGAATVTLTGAQSGIAAHNHTVAATTGSTTPGGGTSGSTTPGAGSAAGSHSHGPNGGTSFLVGGAHTFEFTDAAGFNLSSTASTDTEPTHTHTGAAHTHTTPGAAHTHTLPDTDNVAAANAAQAHANLPPYVALTPLIHI